MSAKKGAILLKPFDDAKFALQWGVEFNDNDWLNVTRPYL
jgi:hypothetical protein